MNHFDANLVKSHSAVIGILSASCLCYFEKRQLAAGILPGRVAQSVGHLARYPVWQHTFVSPSSFLRRAVVSYWRKYVHEVLVNRLGGLSLPSKSVVRLPDRPNMTLDVYRGRKTTMQQQQQSSHLGMPNSKDRFGFRQKSL